MLVQELFNVAHSQNDLIDESWKTALGATALSLGLLSSPNQVEKATNPQGISNIEKIKNAQVKHDPKKLEQIIFDYAKKSGLKGIELAQFMSQIKHESWHFSDMEERPQENSKDYFKKYDVTAKKNFKAQDLGNKFAGDGYKFRGRGYIQLTGRYNYEMAGKYLNLPLVDQPDLAAIPENAKKIALWYWNTRVKPKVKNFSNTIHVTRQINKRLPLEKISRRHSDFLKYNKKLSIEK